MEVPVSRGITQKQIIRKRVGKMKKQIDEVLNRACPACEGTKKKLGILIGTNGKIGLRECIFCKGKGKVTESQYHEKRKAYGYPPEVKR